MSSFITKEHPLRDWLATQCVADESSLLSVTLAYRAYGDWRRLEFKRQAGCDWPHVPHGTVYDQPQQMTPNRFSREVMRICGEQGLAVARVKASRVYFNGLRIKGDIRVNAADPWQSDVSI